MDLTKKLKEIAERLEANNSNQEDIKALKTTIELLEKYHFIIDKRCGNCDHYDYNYFIHEHFCGINMRPKILKEDTPCDEWLRTLEVRL